MRRGLLPDHEPWRAWSNFELIDDMRRVNEVDLLVLTPMAELSVPSFAPTNWAWAGAAAASAIGRVIEQADIRPPGR